MISLGGRNDGRKRSLLGFEGRRVERGGMEENEVEEGEAFPGQDDDLDPDALSYIDKKLQDVLGHFQKEFEGGVSAETLGAKFGGYGSFLPAHQRSPILSHPKSPIKVPIHNVSRSPCSLQSEVGFQTASIPVSTSNTKDNTKSATQLAEKSGKRDAFISTCSMEGIVQHESANKSVNIGDQKSLKVRIKLGPDNVMARNKPEIYSDLGLDVSPSPSLEDSPSGSRELSPESPNSFCESPSTILQVMTCFLIPGGYLLSPLSEALQQSLEKEDNFQKNFKTRMPRKFASEICADSSNISMHAKDVSDFIYKKSKCREKGRKLVQANGPSSEKVMTTSLKNEHGSNTPVTKEEHHIVGDSGKDGSKMLDIHREPNKISTIERVNVFDLGKINHLKLIDSMRTDGTDHSEKKISPSKGNTIPKSRIAGKAFEETSGNGLDSNFDIHRKSKSKTQKISHAKKADSDRRSVRKNFTASQEEHVKEISAQKTCSTEKVVFKTMQDKGQAFEGERLIKGGQSCGPLVEPNKEIRNALFSVSPNAKKKTSHVKGLHLESNSKISKSNKDLNKVHKTESQRDFMVSAHTKYSENGAHVVGSSRSTEKQKERSEVNNVDSICVPGPGTGTGTVPPASINDAVPNFDPAPSVPALVLIEDNWVCCDICQKWRLLPYGTNPESLPKKWHCSMQTWLPGLNSCNISQDKTTKAFHELYQCPAPVGDINLTTHLDTAASSITSADTLNLGRRQENDVHHVLLSGKKKHGVMDADLPNVSSLILLPNSSKNLQVSSGKEELNDVGSLIKSKPANTGISADFAAVKHSHKENHKILSSYKIGADLNDRAGKYSKQLSKRGIDVDGPRTSKKFKKDNSYHSLKVLHSGVDTSDKQDVNGDADLLGNADRNTLQNYSDHFSFKDFKAKSSSSKKKEKVNSSSKGTHKEFCSASEAEEPGKYDSNDKKRKLREWQQRQACQEISVSNQQVVGSRPLMKESLFESELRMQKKAKAAKSEGKESCEVIGGGRIEMKGFSSRIALSSNRKHLPDETDNGAAQPTADEQMVHYQEKAMPGQALDCMDGLKRDVIHMHPLAAAASSSSKVSGSQKNKDNLPEARGSPVESVSSSPMRILNTENSSSRRKSSLKDNVSPKRFSDGEFDGSSDQSGTRTKDQASNACLRSSEVYKSVESGVLDSLKESHGYQDTETNCSPGVKAMDGIYLKMGKHDDVIVSTNLDKTNILSGDGNASHLPNKYHLDRSDKIHTFDKDAFCASGQKKSGKSSLHSKDKHRNFNFDSEKGKLKVLGSCTEHKELHAMRTLNSHDVEAEFGHLNLSKKDDLESHSKQHKVHNLRTAIAGVCQNKNTSREIYVEATPHERQNPSGLLISDEIDRTVVDVRKGMHLSQKAKDKLEKKVWAPQTTPESIKGTSSEQHPLDAVDNDASKPARTSRKYDAQNGTLPNLLRQPTTCVPGSSSPMKKDGHLSVNAFIKEARDLKHTANRLKSVGSEVESSGIFFESAMKFLHAASLLEPHNADSFRQGELVPSTQMLQMYYDTAKFCEFCAHEYERLKEMLVAALAYKCAEVAYLKVAYYKNPGASKDRLELQVALDAPLPGESPSSSASDVDNLNNHGGLDKAASARAASSPQIASNHAIASRNRPHVMRLLTYTNYLNCAFDASKKSQTALSAASIDLGKKGNDGVCSVKKVLDFNYHNVEGLLRLVRLSMHSIGH